MRKFSRSFSFLMKKDGVQVILLFLSSFSLLSGSLYGNPSFARSTDSPCFACHTHSHFPDLNPDGRTFKEMGYRLNFSDDPEGPWALTTPPVSFQGILGVTGPATSFRDSRFSVHSVQIFLSGPIAPRISVYIHHHLVEENKAGELYEAQIRLDQPGDLPFMIRVGKFEPYFANFPKDRITHSGFLPYQVRVGSNPSTLGSPKFGVGTLWFLGDTFRIVGEGFFRPTGPEGFLRPYGKGSNFEVGWFLNGGRYTDLLGKDRSGGDLLFSDPFYRIGLDFALYPFSFLEGNGLFYWGDHRNPSGSGERVRYGAGFLEGKWFPLHQFALALRYERVQFLDHEEVAESGTSITSDMHTHSTVEPVFFPLHGVEESTQTEGKISQVWVAGIHFHLAENALLMGEFRYLPSLRRESTFFLGTHFAF
jgi:hypothetical protein